MQDLNRNRRASKQCLIRDGEGDYSSGYRLWHLTVDEIPLARAAKRGV
jgi:hypothetical protein